MAQMSINWFAPSQTLDIGGSAAQGRQDRTLYDLVNARRQAGELAQAGDYQGAAATLARGGDMQGANSLWNLVQGKEDRTARREDRASDEAFRRDQMARQERQFQMTHGLQAQNMRFQQQQALRPEIVFKENDMGVPVPYEVHRTPNGINIKPAQMPGQAQSQAQPGPAFAPPVTTPGMSESPQTMQPQPMQAPRGNAVAPPPPGVDPKTWRSEQAKLASKNLEESRVKSEAAADLIRKIDRAKSLVEKADPANFGAFNNSGLIQGIRNTGAGLGFEGDVATQQQRSQLEAMYEDMSSTFLKARYGTAQLSNVDMAASKALVGGLLAMNPTVAVQILEGLTPESFDRIKDGIAKGVTPQQTLQELMQPRQQRPASQGQPRAGANPYEAEMRRRGFLK